MNYYPEFADLLAEVLKRQDRTPTWLAHRLKVSPSTVNRWLNQGRRPGSAQTISQIADILGLTKQRQALLIAAGYGYQEIKPQIVEQIDRSVTQPQNTSVLPPYEQLTPFLVPTLPPQRVLGRNEIITQIMNQLAMDEKNFLNIPPVALHGMGGIGKTTIAIALAHSPEIRRAFPDGVLWTSIGPSPTLRNLQDDWGRALGVSLVTERNEAACRDRLRGIVHDQRVLLVIDDVWEAHHGKLFEIAGPRCRTIFTTRESPIAHALATRERSVRIDVLSPKSSLELLASLANDVVVSNNASAQTLCERLEYLPLALTLAGRMLADEVDVPSRMQRLMAELLEQRAMRLHLLQAEGRLGLSESEPVSLQAILGISVERLDRTDQERFAMLAVFGGEPLTWDLPAATYVWDCSIEQAEITLSTLIQRGLVARHKEQFWMHALLADYAAEMLQEIG